MAKTYKLKLDFLIQLLAILCICACTVKCGHENIALKKNFELEIQTAVQKFISAAKNSQKLTNFNFEFYKLNENTLNNIQNVSLSCQIQMENLLEGLKNQSEWALKVIDSYGKPPAGILKGALVWPGDYKECVETEEASVSWKSKYCTLQSNLASQNSTSKILFRYGICMPINCTDADISSIYNLLSNTSLSDDLLSSDDVICHYDKEFDKNSKIAIGIFCSYFVLVLIGTLFDLIKLYIRKIVFLRESRTITFQFTDDSYNDAETQNLIADITEKSFFSDESTCSKLLSNFSIYSNSIKIFKNSNETSRLKCLHAIRVLSLVWVILGHTYGFITMFSDNLSEGTRFIQRFSFMIISNAFFSVDNFFLLSGLLVSYKFIKELKTPDAKFNFGFMLKYYLHRLWRLTPTYIFVLAMSSTITKYLGSGPFFPMNGFESKDNCENYWWMNLLYVNNFLKQENMCFPIGWYLANDMQFHWIAPLILIPIAFDRKYLGSFIGLIFLLANILSVVLILYANPLTEQGIFGPNSEAYMNLIYNKPWSRCGPFIIGVFLGWILLNQDKMSIKPVFRIIIWILSLVICSLCIFGLYPDFQNFPQMYFDRNFHIFYQSFSRIFWAIGVSCIIFACGISKGKLINKILTLRVWVPLSKLSYSAYLIHLICIFYFYTTQDRAMHIQDISLIYFFLGNLAFSYAASFFICTCIELPFIGLEKLILKKKQT